MGSADADVVQAPGAAQGDRVGVVDAVGADRVVDLAGAVGAGGALVAQLPGLADALAIGGLVGAVLVSDLRLPVASIIFVLLITHAGGGVAPVTIVAVVVAQIATLSLTNRRHRTREAPPR